LSAALAKAQDTRDRLERRQKSLALLQRQSLSEVGQKEGIKEKLYYVFEQEKRFAEDDRRQLGRELQELQALQAVQAGTAQHGEQDDTDLQPVRVPGPRPLLFVIILPLACCATPGLYSNRDIGIFCPKGASMSNFPDCSPFRCYFPHSIALIFHCAFRLTRCIICRSLLSGLMCFTCECLFKIYIMKKNGLRKNKEMAGVDDLVVYMQTAVKYSSLYIHQPGGGVYLWGPKETLARSISRAHRVSIMFPANILGTIVPRVFLICFYPSCKYSGSGGVPYR